MNSTVELVCTSRVEWSDRCAIIAIVSDIYGWRSAFCLGLRGVAIPGAIFDDVLHWHIIDQGEHLALFDGYRAFDKASSAHMNLRTSGDSSFIVDCTGGEDDGQ